MRINHGYQRWAQFSAQMGGDEAGIRHGHRRGRGYERSVDKEQLSMARDPIVTLTALWAQLVFILSSRAAMARWGPALHGGNTWCRVLACEEHKHTRLAHAMDCIHGAARAGMARDRCASVSSAGRGKGNTAFSPLRKAECLRARGGHSPAAAPDEQRGNGYRIRLLQTARCTMGALSSSSALPSRLDGS
jgi:hypothetical protein